MPIFKREPKQTPVERLAEILAEGTLRHLEDIRSRLDRIERHLELIDRKLAGRS